MSRKQSRAIMPGKAKGLNLNDLRRAQKVNL